MWKFSGRSFVNKFFSVGLVNFAQILVERDDLKFRNGGLKKFRDVKRV